MNPAHEKIIDAIIRKAEAVCPDSLALIGVYGSEATGDLHGKSDLDLLILINDEKGWQLGAGFILEDSGIGYDIYCTSWEMLEGEAECEHAHLSKLMDSKILYVCDEAAPERLEGLKRKAADILSSETRFEKAQAAWDNAKRAYADCCMAQSMGQVRLSAGGALYFLLDAVMLHHGKYYRRGVKRTFEELAALELPFDMGKMVMDVICAKDADGIRGALTELMRAVQAHMARPAIKQPAGEQLCGTYEEMFSNWRNKMTEAADRGDVFASFMNLLSFRSMLGDIAEETEMEISEVMEEFDAEDLQGNAEAYDRALEEYRQVLRKAGVEIKWYANVEEFAAEYLK